MSIKEEQGLDTHPQRNVHSRTQRKGSLLRNSKEREATGETKPADPLMLHFEPAELRGNVYLNFPGRHSVLWQPYQTNTPTCQGARLPMTALPLTSWPLEPHPSSMSLLLRHCQCEGSLKCFIKNLNEISRAVAGQSQFDLPLGRINGQPFCVERML